MSLRILFTLAILAGLAAAPAAQTFRWQAGADDHARFHMADRVAERVHRAIERATDRMERSWDRLADRWADRTDRSWWAAERASDRIRARVLAQVGRRLDRDVRTHASHASGWYTAQRSTSDNPCEEWRGRGRDSDDEQHCEVRDQSMPAGRLTVDATPNGSISVEAWDRSDIKVLAIVRTSARDEARAKEIAAAVQVQTAGGRVSATGPDTSRREWWSVSYRVSVPRRNDLDLSSRNGGITINGVTGRVEFDTTNGGVRLVDLGGSVRGSTHNGGLMVTLGGQRWDGEGLDVETTNGGVTLSIPDGYNAELETRTRNGGFRTDYPITLQGELTSRDGLHTTLGAGGAPIRVRTSNGGLRIARR